MKISVIIPVYNVENYIVECLNSIVNQTYRNLEIILVDDGSTDNSGLICDDYAKKDNRIQVIHKVNGGLVSARKAGVRCATGEYVSYVDSDDWVELDMYETIVNKIGGQDVDMVEFNHIREYGNRSIVRNNYLQEGLFSAKELQIVLNKYYKNITYFHMYFLHISLWTKLIKRTIIQKAQETIEDKVSLVEDFVSYLCVAKSKNLLVLDAAFYHYRLRAGSVSRELRQDKYEQFKITMEYVHFLIKEAPFFKRFFIYHIHVNLLSFADGKKLYLDKEGNITLFPNLAKNDKVILCGRGSVGKNIYRIFENTNLYTVVDWIDDKEISILADIDGYDYVIIALAVAELVQDVEYSLIQMGIPVNKIMKIEPKNMTEENLPEDIKNILNGY